MPALATFILISLPWLNPFAIGPTAAVGPLLFSWTCAALLLLVWSFAHDSRARASRSRAILLAWVAVATVSACIGLLQYLGASGWLGIWANHPAAGEAYGNLRQRNQFATLMNMGLAALLCWACLPNWSRAKLTLLLLLVTLIGAANAASSSRTGLLQLLLLGCLLLVGSRRAGIALKKRLLMLFLTGVAAYVAASLLLPAMAGLDPLSNGAWARLRAGDPECSSRLTLWRNVIYLITQKPWLGWGWGELDYAHFVTLFPGLRFCDILDNAHNLPLQLAVELGLPLAVLLCFGALWLVWRGRPWCETDPLRQLAWAVLAVIALHSLLEYPLWYGPFQMAVLLSVYLLWPKSHIEKMPLAHYAQASAAALLIAYCGVAAWQYQLASQIYLAPEDRMAAYRDNTLEKIRQLWLFQDQVQFAALTISDVNPGNAAQINVMAHKVLHFSPEAHVVELLIESARALGRDDEARYFMLRYQAAFAQDYARWVKKDKP